MLNYQDRLDILYYFNKGYKRVEIARLVGVSPYVITKELERGKYIKYNGFDPVECYSPRIAQDNYLRNRAKAKENCSKLNDKLKELIIKLLEEHYSPEDVAAILFNDRNIKVSGRGIRNWIASGKIKVPDDYPLKLYNCRTKADIVNPKVKKSDTPKRIKDKKARFCKSIEEITEKLLEDAWEIDTAVGAYGSGYILVLIHRRSLFCKMEYTEKITADWVNRVVIEWILMYNIKTLIPDNGSEFDKLWKIVVANKESEFMVYYARVSTPTDKPYVEGFIKLLRRYYPKGKKFPSNMSTAIKEKEDYFNNHRRKSLDYKSPLQTLTIKL